MMPSESDVCRLDEHCARAVTEQDASGAVLEIEDRRHHVAADHENFLVRAGAHELRAHRERVDETRARRRNDRIPRRSSLRGDPGSSKRSQGNSMSGVTVASTIISISSGRTPFAARSFFAASVPRCEEATPGSA